jgi:hypothetical protein
MDSCLRLRDRIPYGSRAVMEPLPTPMNVHPGSRSWVRITCLLLLVIGWGTSARAASLYYDLRPFSELKPAIQDAFELMHEELISPEQRASALASLRHALTPEPGDVDRDPHLLDTARCLFSGLNTEREPAPKASAASTVDTSVHPGAIQSSLEGLTELYGAERLRSKAEPLKTPLALLRVPSNVPDHDLAWLQGVKELVTLGKPALAAQTLEHHLTTPLSSKERSSMTAQWIDLLVASGDSARAVKSLRDQWWNAHTERRRESAQLRLKSLGSSISSVWKFARPLLDVRAGRVAAENKLLKKLRARKGSDKALVDWGRALLARLQSKTKAGAVTAMENLKPRMKGDVRRPLWHLGSAMVLRRVNRDLEAAMHYAAVVSGWPDHPFANRARVESAWLLSRRGLPGEAAALWADAADSSGRGEAQRDALWWGGFAAVLRGDTSRAQRDLSRLRDRYGDERDGVAITWDERASYWLGRTYEAMALLPQASREYASVAARYPMSWHGILSEARLREIVPLYPDVLAALGLSPEPVYRRALEPVDQVTPVTSLRVVREPALELAVAYLRLGRQDRAISALESLLRSGQITAGGRSLLASLYGHTGQAQARQRVLRYGIVMVPEVTPDLMEMYRNRHLLTHEEILVTECLSRGVSPSLFAGLVHVESRFKPKAKSGVGAVGLAQIMPSTARLTSKALLGYKVSLSKLRKPATNLALGAALLGALLDHFRGHAPAALAAYNAGRGATRGWLRDRGHMMTDAFVESIPYVQTRRYAMRVISMAHTYHRLYGFEGELPGVPKRLPIALDSFDVDTPKPAR